MCFNQTCRTTKQINTWKWKMKPERLWYFLVWLPSTCTAWRCPPNAARHSGTRWYLPLEFRSAPLWIRSCMVCTWPPPAASDKGVLLFASSQSTSAIWCLVIRDCRAGSDNSDLLKSSSYAYKEFKVWKMSSVIKNQTVKHIMLFSGHLYCSWAKFFFFFKFFRIQSWHLSKSQILLFATLNEEYTVLTGSIHVWPH